MRAFMVFVYGTLKRGCGNNGLLSTGATFISKATIGKGFTAYDINHGFPFLKEDGGDGCEGELFCVTEKTLMRLDRLEGHPTFYRRTECTVIDEDGLEVVAETYLYQGDIAKGSNVITNWERAPF